MFALFAFLAGRFVMLKLDSFCSPKALDGHSRKSVLKLSLEMFSLPAAINTYALRLISMDSATYS
jgi:hypothetical protein